MSVPIPPVHCRTCMFWRQGWAPAATSTRLPDANPDIGICEYHPPTIHIVNGGAMSMYPAVHADRACWEWEPVSDGPYDGGGNVIPVKFGDAA